MIELLSEKDVTKIPQLEDIFNYIKYIFHYIYIYIYIYITNCRQYSFGLVDLISAVLMLEWR